MFSPRLPRRRKLPAAVAAQILPRLATIASRVKAEVGHEIPMTIFGKGLGYALEDLAATEFDVVGLDWQTDPEAAQATLAKHATGRLPLPHTVASLPNQQDTTIARFDRAIEFAHFQHAVQRVVTQAEPRCRATSTLARCTARARRCART